MKSRTIKDEVEEEDMRRTYLGEKVERGAKTEEKVSLSSEPKIEAPTASQTCNEPEEHNHPSE